MPDIPSADLIVGHAAFAFRFAKTMFDEEPLRLHACQLLPGRIQRIRKNSERYCPRQLPDPPRDANSAPVLLHHSTPTPGHAGNRQPISLFHPHARSVAAKRLCDRPLINALRGRLRLTMAWLPYFFKACHAL